MTGLASVVALVGLAVVVIGGAVALIRDFLRPAEPVGERPIQVYAPPARATFFESARIWLGDRIDRFATPKARRSVVDDEVIGGDGDLGAIDWTSCAGDGFGGDAGSCGGGDGGGGGD